MHGVVLDDLVSLSDAIISMMSLSSLDFFADDADEESEDDSDDDDDDDVDDDDEDVELDRFLFVASDSNSIIFVLPANSSFCKRAISTDGDFVCDFSCSGFSGGHCGCAIDQCNGGGERFGSVRVISTDGDVECIFFCFLGEHCCCVIDQCNVGGERFFCVRAVSTDRVFDVCILGFVCCLDKNGW